MHRLVRHAATTAAVLAVVGAGSASAATDSAATYWGTHCDAAQAAVDGAFYPGAAASGLYESLFRRGFALPHLATHVPQGITTWPKWNSKGATAVLISMYSVSASAPDAYLVAVDAGTGTVIGTVRVAAGHLGGIAVAGGYLFAQHDDNRDQREPVRRYRIGVLSAAFADAARTGSMPYVGRSRGVQTVHGAAFMAVYDGEVWSGRYNRNAPDLMYRYRVASGGKLVANGKGYQVPPRTQGVLVGADRFVFNTSDDQRHGRMVVAPRSRTLSPAKSRCFTTPSMGENLTRVGSKVLALYEGGSSRYPGAVNRVSDLHTTGFDRLRAALPTPG